MRFEGGCYCGQLRYVAEGEPIVRGQCHCRACQHISGGGPNLFMLFSPERFRWTAGTPREFTRLDLENPVTRAFCAECGTHVTTRRPGLEAVILKVGTLDDPAVYGAPIMAIHTSEMQAFHHIPDGVAAFEGMPPRR